MTTVNLPVAGVDLCEYRDRCNLYLDAVRVIHGRGSSALTMDEADSRLDNACHSPARVEELCYRVFRDHEGNK